MANGHEVRIPITTDSSELRKDITKSVKKLQEMSKKYEDIQNQLKSRGPEEFAKQLGKALDKNNAALDKEKRKLEELEEAYNNRANKIREMRSKGASEDSINKEYEKQQNTQNRMDQSTDRINKLERENFEITEKTTKQWQLQNDALRTQGEELKNNFNILEKIMNQDIKDQKGAKIKDFFKGVGAKIGGMFGGINLFDSKGIDKAANGFGSMAKYAKSMMFSLLGAQTIFSLISKAVNQIKQDNKELANTINTLWNGLVAFIEPVVNGIVQMLATALNYVLKMLSVIGGTSVLNFLNKANKKANARKSGSGQSGQLYSFDSSETLQKNGGGGTSLENSFLKDVELNEKLLELAKKIKEFWEKIKAISIDWWKKLDFEPLIKGLNDVWDALMPLLDTIGNTFLWLYENILLPFLGWLIEDIIPDLLEILAPVLTIIQETLDKMGELLEPLWNDVLQPMFEALGDGIDQVLTWIGDGLKAIAENETAVTVLAEIADLALILGGAFLIISTAIALMSNPIFIIIAALAALVAAIGWVVDNWDKLKQGFTDTLNKMIDSLESFINKFVDGWNNLMDSLSRFKIDLPNWSIFGSNAGKSWSPTAGMKLNNVSIPRLAQGAVIQPNKPFMAMLGDQTSGQNLEAPEGLIRQIVREESGSSIRVTADSTASEFVRWLKFELEKEGRRVGASLVG